MSKKHYFEDIICARSTPPGPSAIAVIRVSGKNSWNLLKTIFKPKSNIENYKTHKIYYGDIYDDDNYIDNVIILTFKSNSSFTGEESFEINCHGSEIIISLILKLLFKKGARLAEPGEFTKRAFLNDKIDLTEAESIMDIVNSSTKKSALIASRQLSGKLSSEINKIKKLLSDIIAEIEVNIDYPEEDLSLDIDNSIKKINEIKNMFDILLKSFQRGRYFREGIKAVILGKTNSGKSTLFNLLLNEDKAIVSDIHGTTRDFLDGMINISGYGIRIYDTAGLRETDDPIEKEGTLRAIQLSKNSDVVIYIISAEQGLHTDDKKNIKDLECDKLIVVINKIDLVKEDKLNELKNYIHNFLNELNINFFVSSLSALNKIGLDEFNSIFIKLLINDNVTDSDDPVMTNERHAHLIEQARNFLEKAIDNLNKGFLDLSSFELWESMNKLGEITGEVTTEEILNKIFSNFCVGK
jgi:tRNA modification GTPase